MSIADTVVECAETFRKLRSILAAFDAPDEEKRLVYSGLLEKVGASFERLQLWSSNLGAHRRDKNSLDKRLSEASNLQRRVLQYLKDIKGGLEGIIDIVSGKITPWDELSESSSEESQTDDEEEDGTELEQLIRYVDNAVTCLLRISTVIQKPAPHDRFIKSGKFDQSFRQKWDEQHVSDKFAKVPEWMAIRLGKANSRRRQFLEYRKNQHEQIASLHAIDGDNKTVVSSLPSAIKHNQDMQNMAGSEAAHIIDDFDDRESQTSYAETVANEDALLVPTMPEDAAGGSLFECPYCFLIVEGIHNRMQWKRHVYTDLQPYICLHPDCMSADETFARRHSWIKHDTHVHRKIWRCNMGCDQDFSSKIHIQDHFAEFHGLRGASDHHLDALSVNLEIDNSQAQPCPLCDHQCSTLKRYYKHVGQHLEQLALFVIPRDSLEEVDEALEDNDDQVSKNTDFNRDATEGQVIVEEVCDSCEKTTSDISYCNDCAACFCDDCWSKQLPHRRQPPAQTGAEERHKRIPIALARERNEVLTARIEDSLASLGSANQEEHHPDEQRIVIENPPKEQPRPPKNKAEGEGESGPESGLSSDDEIDFEKLGINPADDPELALALRMGIEEEKARKKQQKAHLDEDEKLKEPAEGKIELEPIAEGGKEQQSQSINPVETTSSKASTRGRRANQWFVSGEGISHAVITADIQRYLGPDALVRPGVGTEEFEGTPGYWVTGYRSLTSQMIQDLKMDSQRWETEKQRAPRGRDEIPAYQDSRTHAARQHWGPSKPSEEDNGYTSSAQPYTTSQMQSPYNTSRYLPSATPAPGYYIASDGRQYPLSQMPLEARESYEASQQAQSPMINNGRTRIDSTSSTPPGATAPHPDPTDKRLPGILHSYFGQDRDSLVPQRKFSTADPTQQNTVIDTGPVAAPGYYLASDGRQYPISSMPEQARGSYEASQKASSPKGQQYVSPILEPVVAQEGESVVDVSDTKREISGVRFPQASKREPAFEVGDVVDVYIKQLGPDGRYRNLYKKFIVAARRIVFGYWRYQLNDPVTGMLYEGGSYFPESAVRKAS